MPYYASNEDLPLQVRDLLPEHGRDIYREAFNSAWEQYADPSERRNPEESREEVAHKVAWAAVERVYEKGPGGEWKRKEEAKRQVVPRDRQPEAASPESGPLVLYARVIILP